jgi:membrane-bound lytic murein transglycosylase D
MHGIRLSDLVLANNLDRRATIYVNQNLRLPQPGESAILVASAKPAAQPAPAPRPTKKAPAPTPETDLPASEPATAAATLAANTLEAGPPLVPADEAVAPTATVPVEVRPEPTVDIPVETPLLATLIPEPFPMTIGHLAEPEVVSVTGTVVRREEILVDEGPYDMWRFPPAAATGAETDTPESGTAQGDAVTQDTPRDLNLAMVTGHLKVERTGMVDGVQVGYIRVEVEETLGHFADWLEIRTHRLRRLNGFSYGQVLHTHQRIKIPFKKISRETFEERRFEYHQRIQEDFFAAFQVESLSVYRVKSGDSLWTLADERFGVPMWLLKRCNPEVDFGALHPNQELRIPVVEKLPDRAAAETSSSGGRVYVYSPLG